MFAALIDFISLCIIIGLPIIFLILLFVLRKLKYRWIPGTILILFVLTTGYAIHYFISEHEYETENLKKYIGLYKLDKLDCKVCENCKIDLLSDYSYTILQDDKIKGKGNWEMVWDPEYGYFLRIDNASGARIDFTKREIEYVNRINCH